MQNNLPVMSTTLRVTVTK